jgi:hypothetical protein
MRFAATERCSHKLLSSSQMVNSLLLLNGVLMQLSYKTLFLYHEFESSTDQQNNENIELIRKIGT